MTEYDFRSLCAEHCIDLSLALLNSHLVEALRATDDALVIQIINDEF